MFQILLLTKTKHGSASLKVITKKFYEIIDVLLSLRKPFEHSLRSEMLYLLSHLFC